MSKSATLEEWWEAQNDGATKREEQLLDALARVIELVPHDNDDCVAMRCPVIDERFCDCTREARVLKALDAVPATEHGEEGGE